MKRYRRILVCFDGSESGRNAFRQACKIVREEKSWITALTVVPPYMDMFQTPAVQEKIRNSLRSEGERAVSEMNRLGREEDVYVKVVLEDGIADEVIEEVAEEGGYNLIVMGRHGKTRLERALMGSVTARVISHSGKDVLVVPEGASLGWKNALFCTDGSERSKVVMENALGFAKAYSGKVAAVYVVDVPEEFYAEAPDAVEQMIRWGKEVLAEVKKRADDLGVEVETYVLEGDAHKKIVELSARKNADMIFMGTRGRTGIGRLVMGSVTGKVIGLSTCPVLVTKS